jgi:hypothetical protein
MADVFTFERPLGKSDPNDIPLQSAVRRKHENVDFNSLNSALAI